ncbi:class III lanthionine synthetase LanKC N-terminal domain-containing protein [Streptomyces sp. NBC_01803]|uniref:class III lanthionine synthetase LanKC N-terminal domain-containing protein n=1 Tax=Streptomyces sp. NBC_01803 TaxID=2975946 RepID=UPI002DDAC2FC|nr:lanthionine synthetase LanC family protein [Streptomyces sp. NBC_01803]WSA43239.1 protein kinase [Streptomyces sp. NBC_01803]
MPGWDGGDLVRRALAGAPVGARAVSLRTGAAWVTVVPDGVPLAAHGWKLHISSRAVTFPALAAVLLPRLLAERCHFKLARSEAALARLNSGRDTPAAVGKAVTVYPGPARVRDLGLALAALLRGHEGPRVLSDRRIAADAPVYYRYGPFIARWVPGERGGLGIRIPGPDGEWFDAVATLEYRRPSWAADPFGAGPEDAGAEGAGSGGAEGGGAPPLGGRYRPVRGIHQAAQGNVYRAEDTATGRPVIVKQARAYVGEGRRGDARTRLRNERRVLAACRDLAGVPAFVDHFAHGPDEFLVTTDVGALNLLHRVRTGGALPVGELRRVARRIAGTLVALHDRGIVMRDVTPRNVVLGAGRAFLVDFGLSALAGFHPPGGTPGFAPPGQLRDEPPDRADDCFAFGMTLGYAATGMLPLAGIAERALARRRMLQGLGAAGAGAGTVAAIGGLLADDRATAEAALRDLAAGRWPAGPGPAPPGTAPPPDEPVARLTERVLDLVLAGVGRYHLDGDEAAIGSVDGGLYTGSAGIGLELLHHRDRPGVPAVLRLLVAHARAATARIGPAEGLYAGTTGVALFLAHAAAAGFGTGEAPPPGAPPEPNDDVFSGVAGVGLGHLLLADVTGDPGHLAAAGARAEQLLSRDGPRLSVAADSGLPPGAGVDPTFGYAHGLAGVVDFLTGLAARTADPQVGEAALAGARRLARRAAELAGAAAAPSAVPIAASWCQGLAGAARALGHAAVVLGEPELDRAARTAGAACAAWVPRMENLSQCCGASGVGSALLDLADSSGDDRFRAGAERVARHLLVRSHGPDAAPEMIDTEGQDAPLSFGMGYAGILAFLRGLSSPGAPDPLRAVPVRAPPGTPASPRPRPRRDAGRRTA